MDETIVPFGWAWPAAAALGAIIGSFLGAALARLPHGRSIVTGRSQCDRCGKPLAPTELVPIVSWAIQRGRCRTCDAPIGMWQIGCELAAAAIGVLSVLLVPDRSALAAMLLGWQLLLLAMLDWRHFWLPWFLLGILGASGLAIAVARALVAIDPAPLAEAGAGALLGFSMLWLIAFAYRRTRGREGMGAADPLMLGAIGLWVGPVGAVMTLLGASIIGIGGAVALLALGRKVSGQTALPLGSCLALSGWAVFVFRGFG